MPPQIDRTDPPRDAGFHGRVVIIGGDLHGAYAASLLAAQGVQVTVLEAQSVLGGPAVSALHHAAASVVHAEEADEGHDGIVAGLAPDPTRPVICGWMVHLLDAIASTDALAAAEWPMVRLCGKGTPNAAPPPPLRSGFRPAPLHLKRALMADPLLEGAPGQKAMRRVHRALARLGAGPREAIRSITFGAWLDRIGGTEAAQAVAAHLRMMGAEMPLEMAASRAAAWLQCAWMTSLWASRCAVFAPGGPDVGESLRAALERVGAEVRCGERAMHVAVEGGRVRSVITEHETIDCRAVIAAIDPVSTAALFTEHARHCDVRFKRLRELRFRAGHAVRVRWTGDPPWAGGALLRGGADAACSHIVVHRGDAAEAGAVDVYMHAAEPDAQDESGDAGRSPCTGEEIAADARRACAAMGIEVDDAVPPIVVSRSHAHVHLPPGAALPGVGAHGADRSGGISGLLFAGSWCDVPSAGLSEGAFEAAHHCAARLLPGLVAPQPVPTGMLVRRLRYEDKWPPPAG